MLSHTKIIIISIILITLLITLVAFTNRPQLHYIKCEGDTTSNKMFTQVLQQNSINPNPTKYNLILHCKRDYSNHYIEWADTHNSSRVIVECVYNNKYLGNKLLLWKTLLTHYKRDQSEQITLPTYILPDDHLLFLERYQPGQLFIAKNEKQRQTGLKLMKNVDEMFDHKNMGYYLIQKVELDVKLYRGHKINLRGYLLVICQGQQVNSYLYNKGIISYAASPYDINNITFENTVSTFYSSTTLYDQGYPITWATNPDKKSYDVDSNLYQNMINKTHDMMTAVEPKIKERIMERITFMLFGVDYLVDSHDNVKILEVNIGPGMTPHNGIDDGVRREMYNDLIGLLFKGEKGGFTLVV